MIVILRILHTSWNWAKAAGNFSAIWLIGMGVRTPATTSSPWALVKNSPKSFFSPVAGLRVKATPVPQSSPMLPKAMDWTLTAVPQE